MKKRIKYFLLLFSLLFAVQGCLDMGYLEPVVIYGMANRSGQDITLVYQNEEDTRDEVSTILIKNGENSDHSGSSLPLYLRENKIAELYFGDVKVKEFAKKRNPFKSYNYTKVIVDDNYTTYTFTFTPEDYQHALNQE